MQWIFTVTFVNIGNHNDGKVMQNVLLFLALYTLKLRVVDRSTIQF